MGSGASKSKKKSISKKQIPPLEKRHIPCQADIAQSDNNQNPQEPHCSYSKFEDRANSQPASKVLTDQNDTHEPNPLQEEKRLQTVPPSNLLEERYNSHDMSFLSNVAEMQKPEPTSKPFHAFTFH